MFKAPFNLGYLTLCDTCGLESRPSSSSFFFFFVFVMETSGNRGSDHLPRFGMELSLNEASQEPVVITDLSEGSGYMNTRPALEAQPTVGPGQPQQHLRSWYQLTD